MKKSDLRKLPIGSIFHLDYNGRIYKYMKVDNEIIRTLNKSRAYGVLYIYNITLDMKIRKNSIFVDNWYFEKGYIKVKRIEKPTQYELIDME